MKLLLSLAFFLAASTYASTSSEIVSANTEAGSLSVSISDIGLGFQSGGSGMYTYLAPTAEYFVMNDLAIGLTTSLSYYSNTSEGYLGLGPTATYHFWRSDEMPISAYGRASLMINDVGSSSYMSLNLGAGANYNFANWFGVGPQLTMSISSNRTALTAGMINAFFYF